MIDWIYVRLMLVCSDEVMLKLSLNILQTSIQVQLVIGNL